MARAEGGGLVGIVFFLFVDVPRPWAPESIGIFKFVPEGVCMDDRTVEPICCSPSFPRRPKGLFAFRFRRLSRFRLAKFE